MNNKRLISLTICWILVVVLGLCVLSFADNESGTNTKAEQHFQKANELHILADYDAAITEYETVISLSPNSKIAQNAQYWIGQLYLESGQFDAALSAFQKLLNEYPASTIIQSTKLMMERVQQAKKNKSLFEAVQKGDLKQVEKLISEGADVNASMRDGPWTPLLDAASTGQSQVVKLLLQHGAKVDAGDSYGYTPLVYALWSKDEECVRTLISADADINKRPNENDYPPLFYAVWESYKRGVKMLIDAGADVNYQDETGWTSLHYAIKGTDLDMINLFVGTGVRIPDFHNAILEGNLARVKQIVESGMDVDTRDKLGWTPTYWAVSTGHDEVFKYLLSQSTNVRVKTNKGRTLLHQASQAGFVEMVKLLIAKGADVNAAADDGTHPLGDAALNGHEDVVKLLLANGADINLNVKGMGTALSAAAFGGYATIVDLLIANGANVNVIGRGGTELHWAAYARQSVDEKRYAEVVKKLLAVGADIHAKDPQRGRTPLHKAVIRGHDKVAGLLIAAGAEVDARDDEKQATPLHLACSRGHRDAAELLIAKGADVNAKNKEGHTPLWYAKDKDRTEIVELLRKHGAKE